MKIFNNNKYKKKLRKYFKKIICLVYHILNTIIPHNKVGDKFFLLILFIIRLKRLPTKKYIFNDFFFKIKTSREILNPLRVFVSDKEFVKIYIKALVGDKYNVPTIAILKNKDQVDTFDYPLSCCIKPTNSTGKTIFRKNGEFLDKSEIKKWFSINSYRIGRALNYKELVPKIIIEPIIFNNVNIEDYKFFCFNGRPKFIQVDIDRYTNHRRKFFDCEWNELDFSILYPKSDKIRPKPINLDEMIEVAKNLSKNFSLIRIDMYSNGKHLYVGEITNVHGNSNEYFIPKEAEITASKILFN